MCTAYLSPVWDEKVSRWTVGLRGHLRSLSDDVYGLMIDVSVCDYNLAFVLALVFRDWRGGSLYYQFEATSSSFTSADAIGSFGLKGR